MDKEVVLTLILNYNTLHVMHNYNRNLPNSRIPNQSPRTLASLQQASYIIPSINRLYEGEPHPAKS